jgi:hypothetical protein
MLEATATPSLHGRTGFSDEIERSLSPGAVSPVDWTVKPPISAHDYLRWLPGRYPQGQIGEFIPPKDQYMPESPGVVLNIGG